LGTVAEFRNTIARRAARIIQFAQSISYNRIISDCCDKVQVAFLIRGGIGDAMIAARWLNQILPFIKEGGNCEIDVYYALPENIAFLLGNLDCVRYIYHDITYDHVCKYYNLALVVNHLGFLEAKKIDLTAISDNPQLSRMLTLWMPGIEEFKRFTTDDYHPNLASDLARFIERHGFKRHEILRAQTGVSFPVKPFPFFYAHRENLSQYAVLNGRYLTVHDGWDSQLMLGSQRPTKSYPREKWLSLICSIKARFPDIAVVQLGGDTGADIPGVHLNLRKEVHISTAVRILKSSRLHIDTDSGLVHIAASLGTKAVVLFGPTDVQYFGYPENVNINASGCNNCWLSSGRWITTCLMGDNTPRCMQSILEEPILGALKTVLANDIATATGTR
jgi:hypothetical protein